MRTTMSAFLALAAATPALAQDFRGGYELVVAQHPTEANPEAIVEVWSWTDLECADGQVVLGGGNFRLALSHPILEDRSFVWVDCELQSSGFYDPCDWGTLPSVVGTVILPFGFAQHTDRFSYDNPLHVMNVRMTVEDLTPRDVTLRTQDSAHTVGCVADGQILAIEETHPVIDGQTTIHVNPPPPCVADFDGDGVLTVFDFLAYQNAFAAGDLRADLDGDGELTLFDFLGYQTAFDAGCA